MLPTVTNPVVGNYNVQFNYNNNGYEQFYNNNYNNNNYNNNNYNGVADLPQPIITAAGVNNVQIYQGGNNNYGNNFGVNDIVDNNDIKYYGQSDLYNAQSSYDVNQNYNFNENLVNNNFVDNSIKYTNQYDNYQSNIANTNYQNNVNVPYQQQININTTYNNQLRLNPQINTNINNQVLQTQQIQKPEIDAAASYSKSVGIYEATQKQITQKTLTEKHPQQQPMLLHSQTQNISQNSPVRNIQTIHHAVTDQRLRKDNEALRANLNRYMTQINQYQNQIQSLSTEREKLLNTNQNEEIIALKAENEAAKAQLAEMEILRKKVAEMEGLRNQLLELNTLRLKIAELNSLKSQLGELSTLKNQSNENDSLRSQLAELTTLRAQASEAEQLRKKVAELENITTKYEQEITKIRTTKSKNEISYNTNNNQELTFEKQVQQITVKGDILHNTNELEMLTRKINKNNQKLTLNLLYKASADSDKAMAFHEKCDNAQSSIVLVETTKGKRFGGFTACSWEGDCIDKKDEDAFVFSLDKMMTYDNIPGEDAIGCYPKFGPIFLGCQIRIYDDAFVKGGTTFERGLNYNTDEDFELTDGDRVFGVKEIEVYEVIPE